MRPLAWIFVVAVTLQPIWGCSGSGGGDERRLLPEAPPAETASEPEADSKDATELEDEQNIIPRFPLPLEYRFDPPPVPKEIQEPAGNRAASDMPKKQFARRIHSAQASTQGPQASPQAGRDH